MAKQHPEPTDVQEQIALHDINWKRPDPAAVHDFILRHYEDGKDRRQDWEREASEQLDFVRGNQWDAVRARYDATEEEGRITINMLRSRVFGWLGLVMGRPLEWKASPMSHGVDDVNAARVQRKLLRHYWTQSDMERKLLDALWLVFCTGVAWLHPTWDPHGGGHRKIGPGDLLDDEDGDDVVGRFRGEIASLRGMRPEDVELDEDDRFAMPNGDATIEVVSGFMLTEPAYCRHVSEAPWLICTRVMSVETMRARYSGKSDFIQPDATNDEREQRRFARQRSDDPGYRGTTPDSDCVIHELWRPRSEAVPRGLHVVATKTGILKMEYHPFVHGKLPFCTLRESPDPERFRPGSTMRDLIGLQETINLERSYVHGHLRLTVHPRIIAEKELGEEEEAFQVKGPQIIRVNQGKVDAVKPWKTETLPPYVQWLQDMNQRDLDEITRLHRATMGEPDNATQSGKHAERMQAGDQVVNSILLRLISDGLSDAGMQFLDILWQKVSARRMTPLIGDDEEQEILQWKGEDLAPRNSPTGNRFNVRCLLRPVESIQDSLAKIKAMVELGVLNPVERESDRLRLLAYMEDDSPIEDDIGAQHRSNASRENLALVNNLLVVTSEGDDDEIHIHTHRLFMVNSSDFRMAVAKNPGVAAKMKQHVLAHEYNQAMKLLRRGASAERVKMFLADFYQLNRMSPEQMMQQMAAAGPAPGAGGSARPAGPQGRPQGQPAALPAPAPGSKQQGPQVVGRGGPPPRQLLQGIGNAARQSA